MSLYYNISKEDLIKALNDMTTKATYQMGQASRFRAWHKAVMRICRSDMPAVDKIKAILGMDVGAGDVLSPQDPLSKEVE